MTPASLGLLLAAVAPEKRAAAARLWAMTGAVAAALGPALGGGLVQLSWQWAFWINLPIGLLLVLGAIRYVPDVRHNAGHPLPDLPGALVLVLAVGGLVLGLVQGSDWGWTSTRVLGAFALAVLATAVFARRTLRHPSPVIAPALLAVPGVPVGQPRHARLQQRVRCRPARCDPVAAAGLGVRRTADRPGDRARAARGAHRVPARTPAVPACRARVT